MRPSTGFGPSGHNLTSIRPAACCSPGNGLGWIWNRRVRASRAPGATPSTGSACCRSPKLARIEAALFVANGALSARRLAQVATLTDAREATALVEQLNAAYDLDASPFRVERVGAGFQLLTRSPLSTWLDRLHHRQGRMKLSAPMMETLAIIAHRQPCTRADVEAVRGVQSAELIKQLMERGLVRVTGEDDSLGRPFLYGTTRVFLEFFGLTNLSQLPFSETLTKSKPVGENSTETESGEDQPAESTAA